MGGGRLKPKSTRMFHVGDGVELSAIPQNAKEIEAQLTYIVGASMLVSCKFVKEVGLMTEGYVLYYEE